jgi:2-isopropylmalate synthase
MTVRSNIEILDTTLREGEQCYGIFFPIEVKKRLALALNEIGVDFIEVGHPAAAPSIREAISGIVKLKLKSRLIAHARLDNDEIRVVRDLGLRWVGLFCGINNRSQSKYNVSKRDILKKVEDAVFCAKAFGMSIKFTCEDASRTDISDLIEFYSFLISLGVERISYADTLGILKPNDIDRIQTLIGGQIPFNLLHFHFHDDFGFADQNATKAIECGARCIDTSVLGVGERMGLVSLEYILSFLRGNRGNIVDHYNTAVIGEAVRLVESCINYEHFRNRRFAHKSGIHIDGIIKDNSNYEPIAPELCGSRRLLVLSKLIGKSGLQQLLSRCGFKSNSQNIQFVLDQIKSEDTLELGDLEEINRYFINKGLERHSLSRTV